MGGILFGICSDVNRLSRESVDPALITRFMNSWCLQRQLSRSKNGCKYISVRYLKKIKAVAKE
jgi:hypothetical protein